MIYAFEWDYDLVGNRTYEDRDGVATYYEYNAGNQLTRSHELAGDTWTYFAYDARGNSLRIDEPDGTTYFEYTAADMVSSIRYKTGTSNYFHYDASLRRYAMEDSAGLSYFTWDDDGMELLAERDVAGAVTAGYTHGETPIGGIGTLVAAAKDAGGGSTEYQYPIYDHRGSVVRLVDETGTVTATYEYDAWGNVLQDTETITTGNRFGYQSNWIRLTDSDGRLCLSPTRVYDVGLGRWLQRDRLGYVDGMCLYEYGDSSASNLEDSLGESTKHLYESMADVMLQTIKYEGFSAYVKGADNIWEEGSLPTLKYQAFWLTQKRLRIEGRKRGRAAYVKAVLKVTSDIASVYGGGIWLKTALAIASWGADTATAGGDWDANFKKASGIAVQKLVTSIVLKRLLRVKAGRVAVKNILRLNKEIDEVGGKAVKKIITSQLKGKAKKEIGEAIGDMTNRLIFKMEGLGPAEPWADHKFMKVSKMDIEWDRGRTEDMKGDKFPVSGMVVFLKYKEAYQRSYQAWRGKGGDVTRVAKGVVIGHFMGFGCDPDTDVKTAWNLMMEFSTSKDDPFDIIDSSGIEKQGLGDAETPTFHFVRGLPESNNA